MNRRSARNRHRRMPPLSTGVTEVIQVIFHSPDHIERRVEHSPRRRTSSIVAAMLLASLGGGR